jgi:glycosyltransferase involved in cell wall biosynthesis
VGKRDRLGLLSHRQTLKVGLLIYGSLETISGGFLYDRKLVEHLRQCGDQVEVVSLPWRSYGRCLADNLSAGLVGRLASLEVDLLLQDELNHPSLAWLNGRLKRRAAYPLLSVVHHLRCSERRPAWQNALYRLVERRYINSVDGFIFNSRTTQGAVQALLAGSRPALVAYPAGDRLAPEISEAEISARARQPGPLRVLFLGNLIERKGLHTLIQACGLLPPGAWRLDIVGRQDVDLDYTRRVQQLSTGLEEAITFHGSLPDERLASLLRRSDVLAVPSSYEGFGIVYLEGMGFGLPAIGATAGAAGELITHNQDGLLVPPEDPPALARALQALAADRSRLAALSLAARRRYLAHPTWEQTSASIREFLRAFVRGFSRTYTDRN